MTPQTGETPKISLRDVTKVFRVRSGKGQSITDSLLVLDGVSLDVRTGEFVSLVGPSGSGKSTLLDLLGGLSTPTSGEVLVNGKPVTGAGLDRAIVFQQYALFPWRTARANVEFGLEAQRVPRRQRAARAREFLNLVGLSGFEDRYPHELSGGMKQRVAIARSLAYDPDILLMDEPFAALDAQTRELLQDELLRIWQATKKTVVFITHGIDEAIYLGQRVVVLSARPGRIKEVIDIDLGERKPDTDLRSAPSFVQYRHQIWSQLHDEVRRAQQAGHRRITPGTDTDETAA
jgi:NitT/TauT family transport system ATP-binding protein